MLQPAGRVYLVLVLSGLSAMVGCRRVDSTAGPSWTSVPGSVALPGTTTAGGYLGMPGTTAAGGYLGMPGTTATPFGFGPFGPSFGQPDLVTIPIDLPAPAFDEVSLPDDEPNLQQPQTEPRPPLRAPEGTVNLALGKAVVCSDPAPIVGETDLVTDGDKEASDSGYLGLRPGTQWVEIDLGQQATIHAVLVWHNHIEPRVYRDVIVQISNDPDFLDARTVFNSDHDNSSGMGIGSDMVYVETFEGRQIDCQGVEGRYVRLSSNGNHLDGANDYTEVEVFGEPRP